MTTFMIILSGIVIFVCGVQVGRLWVYKKPIGTLIINKSEVVSDRPFFELHIEEDPLTYENGEVLGLTLDVRE